MLHSVNSSSNYFFSTLVIWRLFSLPKNNKPKEYFFHNCEMKIKEIKFDNILACFRCDAICI